MKKVLRNQRGISLLEVMIGMLVFALGMLLLIPMVVTSIKGNQTARQNDMVMQDVQKIVEAFKADGLSTTGYEYSMETERYLSWYTQPVTANLEQLNVDVMWFGDNYDYHFRRVSTYVYRR